MNPHPIPPHNTQRAYLLALAACQRLVAAYKAGEESGGSVEWSDLDAAFQEAEAALRCPEAEAVQLADLKAGAAEAVEQCGEDECEAHAKKMRDADAIRRTRRILRIELSGHVYSARLQPDHYQRGGLALQLVDARDGENIATVSVWFPETAALPDDVCYVKGWSENQGLPQQLVEAGILCHTALPPVRSGFVEAHAYRYTPTGLSLRQPATTAQVRAHHSPPTS